MKSFFRVNFALQPDKSVRQRRQVQDLNTLCIYKVFVFLCALMHFIDGNERKVLTSTFFYDTIK